jgi:hypothetical protein
LEIPQRHFAVRSLLRSVPKETFISQAYSLSALHSERSAKQHDRQQQNIPRIEGMRSDRVHHHSP